MVDPVVNGESPLVVPAAFFLVKRELNRGYQPIILTTKAIQEVPGWRRGVPETAAWTAARRRGQRRHRCRCRSGGLALCWGWTSFLKSSGVPAMYKHHLFGLGESAVFHLMQTHFTIFWRWHSQLVPIPLLCQITQFPCFVLQAYIHWHSGGGGYPLTTRQNALGFFIYKKIPLFSDDVGRMCLSFFLFWRTQPSGVPTSKRSLVGDNCLPEAEQGRCVEEGSRASIRYQKELKSCSSRAEWLWRAFKQKVVHNQQQRNTAWGAPKGQHLQGYSFLVLLFFWDP